MGTARNYHSYNTDGEYLGFGLTQGSHVDEAPLISVVVPIYNAIPYLDQALSSIEDQTYQNLEIICINDGSTDDSLAKIQAHAAKDPRIKVIDKKNEGYGATCNLGIEESNGEWIAILEPDDYILPEMYESMIAQMLSVDPDADMVKTPYWAVNDPDTREERLLACSYATQMRGKTGPFTINDALCLFRHHPSIWSAIYRKSFLNEHDIRFKQIPGAGWADNPFLAETLLQAKSIVYLDSSFYCYRADTQEKASAFHKNNPSTPFERWSDMTEVIERLGVVDPGILRVHYERGFLYAGGVLEEHDADEPEIKEMLETMFSKMDPAIVFADDGISPASKRLFAEVLGIEAPRGGNIAHMGYLARRSVYSMVNVGPKELVSSVRRYIAKYAKRAGGR